MFKRSLIFTCSTFAGLAGAINAVAAEDEAALEEVVVVAQRRAENLQDVPIAVTAFNAEALENAGITSTQQIQQMIPGMVISKTFAGSNPYLRGVGNLSFGVGNDPAVSTYLDGLYMPNAAAGLFALNNVERVEVLKGPQGTLFGRNALGGVVQVITKDPSQDPHVDAAVSYGNYDTYGLDFYGTTGLTDNLAVSLAATYSDQREGWGKNLYTGHEIYLTRETGVMAKVKWTAGDATTVTLSEFYNDLNSDVGTNLGIVPGSFGTDGTPYLGRYIVNHLDGYGQTKQSDTGLRIDHDFGWAELASITGYHDTKVDLVYNQNGILGQPVAGRSATNQTPRVHATAFTQELQLLSPKSAPFEWIVGAFYLDDVLRNLSGTYGTCVGTTCAPTPVPTQTQARQTSGSYAGFGQATFNLFSATRLTTGVRYTRDKRKLSGEVMVLPGFPNSPTTLPAGTVVHPGDPFTGYPNGIPTESVWPKVTWRLSLDHKFGDDILTYVSYNRGFKSGVYGITNFTNPPSRPEVMDAYEIGMKSQLFEQRLRLNLAGFYYDYTDIQLRTAAPPAPPGQTITFNAAKARIKGIDADFEMAIVKQLSLTGGFEVLDAKFADFPGGQCIAPRPITATVLGGTVTTFCDRRGATLARAPKFTALLGFDYRWPTAVGEFSWNAKDSYVSKTYFDPSNRLYQKPYHNVSTAVTWAAPSKKWDVQLWARNLLDEFYYTQLFEGGGGIDNYVAGDPRTYGVKLGAHF